MNFTESPFSKKINAETSRKIFSKNDDFYKKFGLKSNKFFKRKQAGKKFRIKSKEFLMRKQAEKIFSKIQAETSRKIILKFKFQKSKFPTEIGNRSSITAKLMPPTSRI